MIRATARLPRRFNAHAFDDEFLDAAITIGDELRVEFHKTVRTWNNRPQFKRHLKQNASETSVEIFTEGKTPASVRPKTPEDIYCILAGGTSKSYAVMTLDFTAKTVPGVIDSFVGSGGFSHLDMDEGRALARAIEARNWDVVIAADKERRLKPVFAAALSEGVRKSGHEYT